MLVSSDQEKKRPKCQLRLEARFPNIVAELCDKEMSAPCLLVDNQIDASIPADASYSDQLKIIAEQAFVSIPIDKLSWVLDRKVAFPRGNSYFGEAGEQID